MVCQTDVTSLLIMRCRWYSLAYVAAEKPVPIAILLLDETREAVLMRWRENYDGFDEDAREVLVGLSADIPKWAREMGARTLLSHFLDTLSGAISISDGTDIQTGDPEGELNRLLNTTFGRMTSATRTHDAGRVPTTLHSSALSIVKAASEFLERIGHRLQNAPNPSAANSWSGWQCNFIHCDESQRAKADGKEISPVH
jgi:hypothetical protein